MDFESRVYVTTCHGTHEMAVDAYTPKTYEEAVTCKDSEAWVKSMNEEIASLRKRKTFTTVPKADVPKGK